MQCVALLTPADIRSLAETLGVRPTKRLGQNFVHDAGTVRRIVRVAGVEPGDVVLEVGPGLGSLTLALLEAGARVVAVEIDPALAAALPGTVERFMPEAAGRLTVVTADALTIRSAADLGSPPASTSPIPLTPSVSEAGEAVREATIIGNSAGESGEGEGEGYVPTKLVANLPYNVATPVILTLLANLPSIQEVLVMVQAEVAERLAAPPGTKVYGSPSAKVAWYGSATMAGMISRTVFWPVPNVDSALVRIVRHPETGGTAPDGEPAEARADQPEQVTAAQPAEVRADHLGVEREAVFAVVDAAFAQRRKTLRAALAGWAGSAPDAEQAIRGAGIDPTRRGETLTIVEFAQIAAARGQ